MRAQRAQRAQGSRARGQTAMSATVTCGSTATVLRVPRMISASNRRTCPGAQQNKRGARGSTLPQGAGSREQPHLTAKVVVQVETLQPSNTNTFVVILECARTHGRSFRERRPACSTIKSYHFYNYFSQIICAEQAYDFLAARFNPEAKRKVKRK